MSHQVEETEQIPPEILAEGYETRDVNIKVIWGWTIGTVVLVGFSYVLLDGLFMHTLMQMDSAREDAAAAPPSTVTVQQREALTRYGVVDKESGIYSIPIDAAMTKLAEEQASQHD